MLSFRDGHMTLLTQHFPSLPSSLAQVPRKASFGSTSAVEVIECAVHGREIVHEPELVALLRSDAVQRLKAVFQAGITANLGMVSSRPVNRYEHSVGAMLLVRRAGEGIEGQAAALLHDIGHTALSHVADSVFGYVVHEDDKREYLDQTSIPGLLANCFGSARVDHILEEANYPLLERDPPSLCADRMDYGLRDSLALGQLTPSQCIAIRNDFTVVAGRFAHATQPLARLFADAYLRCDQIAWANPLHAVLYVYASRAINLALTKGLLRKADFWTYSDLPFWARLVDSPDPDVRAAAARVRTDLCVEVVGDEVEVGGTLEDEGGETLRKQFKVRTLDPDVLVAPGQTQRLSELDPEYKSIREAYIASRARPLMLRVTLPHTAP